MTRESASLFSCTRLLPVGAKVYYKYIVDGEWAVDEASPTVVDAAGNKNNFLLVEQFCTTAPQSPEGPRGQRVDGDASASDSGAGGGSSGGGTASPSAVGSPGYASASAAEARAAGLVGSALLSSVEIDPSSTSYIGVGVMREYTEEYELDAGRYAHQRAKSLSRSSSMSQLDKLMFPSLFRQGVPLGPPSVGAASIRGSAHKHASSLPHHLESISETSSRSCGNLVEAASEATAFSGQFPSNSSMRAVSSNSSLASAAEGSPSSASPREDGTAAIAASNKVQRSRAVSEVMHRAVGVPTSVPLEGDAAGYGFPVVAEGASAAGGGGGGGSSATASAAAAAAAALGAHLSPNSSSGGLAGGGGGVGGGGGAAAGGAASAPGTMAPLTHVQALLGVEGKLVVAMAGLPARGKTFIARHLKRHLGWMGYRTEIFNVGNYRRKQCGARQSHDFFDPANKEGEAQRAQVAALAFQDMTAFLKKDDLDVAIFDATNTTVERRQWLIASLAAVDPTIRLVFVEPICNDEAVVRSNVVETKLKSPDYKGVDEASAVSDFLARIQHYASIYEPLGVNPVEDNVPYIKLIDLGKNFVW
jgi:hypothetical protein